MGASFSTSSARGSSTGRSIRERPMRFSSDCWVIGGRVGMTYEEAACLPQAGAIALQGLLGKGQVQPGQKVLINGAGGARECTLCSSPGCTRPRSPGWTTRRIWSPPLLGADYVIDYMWEDFTRNGRTYDLILDLAAHRSAFACKRSLAPGGRYLCVGGSVPALLSVLLIGPLAGRAEGKTIRVLAVRPGVQHVEPIVELCQAARSLRSSTAGTG